MLSTLSDQRTNAIKLFKFPESYSDHFLNVANEASYWPLLGFPSLYPVGFTSLYTGEVTIQDRLKCIYNSLLHRPNEVTHYWLLINFTDLFDTRGVWHRGRKK